MKLITIIYIFIYKIKEFKKNVNMTQHHCKFET